MSKNRKPKNLERLTKDVSGKVLDSMNLLDVLEELSDGDKKIYKIIRLISKNLRCAFGDIETCRKMISVPD